MKRHIIRILAGMLLLSAILCLIYTRKRDCSEVIPVILYSESAQNYALNGTENRLHIEGTIQKRLFRPAVFSGVIWLDGMEEMKNSFLDKMSVRGGQLSYLFLKGKADVEELANLYTAKLLWGENREQVLLRIYDNSRPNFTVDGFTAAGPYDASKGTEELWAEGSLLSSALSGGEPVYMECNLPDALYDARKNEFVFLGQRPEDFCSAASSEDVLETAERISLPLYVHFEGTGLAFDQISVPAAGTDHWVEVSFRFADLDAYRAGIAELKTALSRLPEETGETERFDGSVSYRIAGERTESFLEIIPHQTQYRFILRIGHSQPPGRIHK